MTFEPNTSTMSHEDLQAMLLAMLQSNPEVLTDFAKTNEDAQRLFKLALPKAPSRSASFLSEVWPIAILAMADDLKVEIEDPEDEDAYKACLKAIDAGVTGTQDACTLSYVDAGREHKVRITVLSEDNNASGVLDKAIKTVAEASAEDFEELAEKSRKRVKTGRVDEVTKKENLAAYDAVVQARKTALEADVPEPEAPPAPPV